MAKAPYNRIVWPFAVSQTISWAAMFYTFPALLGVWESDLGFSKTQLSAALTAALLLSAVFAPIAGRIIDRGHFVAVHVGGTLAGVILLFALSLVTQLWQFFTIWALMGVAMAGVLYEPCFAMLTRTFETRVRGAIIRVTLVAGFAGTLAFPAVHLLTNAFGWRITIMICAVAVLILSVPLSWLASSTAQSHARKINTAPTEKPGNAMIVARTLTFWLLVITYLAFAIDHAMIITHMLPLLQESGLSQSSAVIAASFIGPMQVAGRVVMMQFERFASTVTIAALALFALFCASASLLWVDSWFALVFVFVILQGGGNGVSSIIRPLLTAELLGRKNFGLISGVMAVPFIGGTAFGPSISAFFWQLGGYDSVLKFAILICAIGIVCVLLAARFASKQQ